MWAGPNHTLQTWQGCLFVWGIEDSGAVVVTVTVVRAAGTGLVAK
jgi:hypothetical protein